MTETQGYTYIDNKNHFSRQLWFEIHNGALNYEGKPFSFQIKILTERHHFRWDDPIFGSPGWKKNYSVLKSFLL